MGFTALLCEIQQIKRNSTYLVCKTLHHKINQDNSYELEKGIFNV